MNTPFSFIFPKRKKKTVLIMQSEKKTGHILFVYRLLICCALALICSGCSEDEPVVHVNFSNRVEITLAQNAQAVTYAYLPQYSHTVSFERHRPLVERLAAETGLQFRQVFPDTFDAHIKMVERGEIDISFSNPFIYIKLAIAGAEAFARIIESTGTDFIGQIICRSDNERIKTVADCRGKRWIAVDPSSAGGYLFALGHFIEQDIDRQDFSEIAFAPGPGGKQEKVVLAVYSGQYDIGTIREGTLSVLKDRIDLSQLRILAETRPYPGWVYAARKGLEPAIVDKIAKAMFTLTMEDEQDAVILNAAKMQGIIPATDSDYDPVRDLVVKLEGALGN